MVITLIWGACIQEDAMEQEAKTTPVGDIDIAYGVFGEGYPIVLITGYSATMDMWAPALLQELATHYRVIIFDNRGMGKTTASDKEFTIELFADDTAALLDALNIERAHILGWSMGTYIAQELALRHPDKVDRLLLYAADCGGEEAIQPSPKALEVLADTSGTPQERGERLLQLLFPLKWLEEHPDPRTYFPMPTETSSPENMERQYKAMVDWTGTFGRLPQITQDTLLIAGTDDVIPPPENSFIIAERIPGAWLIQFKDAGHGLMYQYPERLSRIVLTFLQR
jgi:pimeloyl-ACP methyl ester carboxylesterase